MRFKLLASDMDWKNYGGKFVSKKLDNGEFDYWLVISVINLHNATGEYDQERYHVQIEAVSPQLVDKNDLDSALGSCGWSDDDLDRFGDKPLFQVESLSDYGIAALLWGKSGNNIRQLMKAARHESQLIEMFFGFYMDKSENRIGQTGWDLIRGQNVREFLSVR